MPVVFKRAFILRILNCFDGKNDIIGAERRLQCDFAARPREACLIEHRDDRVRRVDAVTGLISTVAGTGINGFSGDGAAATSAQLSYPYGVAVDGVGEITDVLSRVVTVLAS